MAKQEALSDLEKIIALKNIVSECEEMRRMADRIQQKLACFGVVSDVDLDKLRETFKFIMKEFGQGGKIFCTNTLHKYHAEKITALDKQYYGDVYADCLGFLGNNEEFDDLPF